ncbi:hypothetical protein [Pseudomonas sp. CGJS7]|uniref:hypothetical protein n=1 Tax=Pseudomonas sp. CGJS7 TaxID=3109348 RepID=UPI00300ACB44
MFTADLSWAREREPAPAQRRLRADHLIRVALFALLAMAAVGVVLINGPADAGPNRSGASALPDPISEAEVEVDRAVAVPVAASRAAYAVQERRQAAR